jgi:uncharacterized protein (TIGR02452 family)
MSGSHVRCLAFASGKNPGGGFLGGSGGQEESIARSSGYYLCVISQPQLYEFNRTCRDPFHSDHLNLVLKVPIIREELDPYELCEPWPLTVIAAPAVNAGVVRSRNPGVIEKEIEIHQKMKSRIRRILGAAYENGVTHIVLGEYGCGALENNAMDVSMWRDHCHIFMCYEFICCFSGCSLFQGGNAATGLALLLCI